MTVRIERAGAVATVVLSRPEVRNAVDPTTAAELYQAFVEIDQDEGVAVAILFGDHGHFCAGYDLKALATGEGVSWGDSLHFGNESGDPPLGPLGPTRLQMSKPVIAAVAGPAVAGGMELALWCDLRVMETEAFMGVYCRRWGVPLLDGGTVRLPRLIGEGRALDLILTGRKVTADEALRIGLCERVVPSGQAHAAALALAQDIARFPQACVRSDRRSTLGQAGLSERAALEQEFAISAPVVLAESVTGAQRFSGGKGRHGDREDI